MKQIGQGSIKVAVGAIVPRSPYPLFVEGMVGMAPTSGNAGGGTNDLARQFNWVVSGAAGSTTLTWQSGDDVALVGTTPFAAVLLHDDGEWRSYVCLGASGNTITLATPLVATATNQPFSNRDYQGNHYSENGYYALADLIYNTMRRYAVRERFVAQMLPTDASGPWTLSNITQGGYLSDGTTPSGTLYNNANNLNTGLNGRATRLSSRALRVGMEKANASMTWTQPLRGLRGHLEMVVGSTTGKGYLTVTLDGAVAVSQPLTIEPQRIIVPYYGVQTGVITIGVDQAQATAAINSVDVGRVTWWAQDTVPGARVLDPGAKIVLFGDSWTQYPVAGANNNGSNTPRALQRRLEQRLSAEGGAAVNIINNGKGGMTSRWARWWFKEKVLDHKPDYAILEFFTNDSNSVAMTELKPDGTSAAIGVVGMQEWLDNLRWMVDQCLQNGIVPIVVMPSGSSALGQTQIRGAWAEALANGGKLDTSTASFGAVTATSVTANTYSGGTGSTPLKITSSEQNSAARKGVTLDSGVPLTGALSRVATFANNGTDVGWVTGAGRASLLAYAFTGTSTKNNLPGASSEPNTLRLITNPDAGKSPLVWSDGTVWRYVGDNSQLV